MTSDPAVDKKKVKLNTAQWTVRALSCSYFFSFYTSSRRLVLGFFGLFKICVLRLGAPGLCVQDLTLLRVRCIRLYTCFPWSVQSVLVILYPSSVTAKALMALKVLKHRLIADSLFFFFLLFFLFSCSFLIRSKPHQC